MPRNPVVPVHAIEPSAPQALAFLETQYGVVQSHDVGAMLGQLRTLCAGPPMLDAEQRKQWDLAVSVALCGDAYAATDAKVRRRDPLQ